MQTFINSLADAQLAALNAILPFCSDRQSFEKEASKVCPEFDGLTMGRLWDYLTE